MSREADSSVSFSLYAFVGLSWVVCVLCSCLNSAAELGEPGLISTGSHARCPGPVSLNSVAGERGQGWPWLPVTFMVRMLLGVAQEVSQVSRRNPWPALEQLRFLTQFRWFAQ